MRHPAFRGLMLLAAGAAIAATLVTCRGEESGGESAASGDEIVVVMKDNVFEPETFEVPIGETVTITVKNEGAALHNMTIPGTEFTSEQIMNAGDTSSFEVNFDEAGTYAFQCDFHIPGMTGTITVE